MKDKIINDIISQCKKTGKAEFPFGTFRVIERRKSKVQLRNGKKVNLPPFKALFFKGSRELKDEVKRQLN